MTAQIPTHLNIIRGQRVEEAKLQRARQMRRQMTAEEAILWTALRTDRLHRVHFRRQQIIAGFIVDFYCHAAGLIIEVDGPIHDQQKGYDAARDQILRARNLRISRVKNDEVRENLGAVLECIATEVAGQV